MREFFFCGPSGKYAGSARAHFQSEAKEKVYKSTDISELILINVLMENKDIKGFVLDCTTSLSYRELVDNSDLSMQTWMAVSALKHAKEKGLSNNFSSVYELVQQIASEFSDLRSQNGSPEQAFGFDILMAIGKYESSRKRENEKKL